MSTVVFQTQTQPSNPSSGKLRFYVDSADSILKSVDSAGTVTNYGGSLSTEQVQDIVGGFITAGSLKTIVTYNDVGNVLTIDIDPSQIDHTTLQNIGTNTHAQIDTHIANTSNPHATTAAQVGADPSGSAAAVQAASLQKSNNLSDLTNASTARTNLGLGTAATQSSSAFDAAGTASTAITAHNAASDPHSTAGYIKADGTRAMSGNLSLSGTQKVINAAQATAAGQYVEYNQWQAALSGSNLILGVVDPNLMTDALSTPPGSPVADAAYLVGPSATGAWVGKEGHVMVYHLASWVDMLNRAVAIGDKFCVTNEYGSGSEGGNMVGKHNHILTLTNATPGSYAYTDYTPTTNDEFTVWVTTSLHLGDKYHYDGTIWIEIPNPNAFTPGAGLSATGNIWNVNTDGITTEVNGLDQISIIPNTFDAYGASAAVLSSSLQKSSNLSDLANVTTARTNLGLGTAATQNSTAFESAIAAGTSTQYWRGDKTWQTLNSSSVGLGNVNNTADTSKTIAGDVSGTLGASTVDKLKGVAVSATTPTIGQVLKYDGTQWAPGTDNNSGGGGSTTYTINTTANSALTLTAASNSLQCFIGSTPGQSIIMPNATTLTAGTSYEFSNKSPVLIPIYLNGGALLGMLYPESDLELLVTDVSTAAGTWYKENGVYVTPERVALFEEFISTGITSGTIGELPWTLITATGHTVSYATSTATEQGVLVLGTGTGVAAGGGIHLGQTSGVMGGGVQVCEWRIKPLTLSTAAQEYELYFGLLGAVNVTTEPTLGLYFSYQRATTGINWQFKSANTIRTTVNTGTTVAINTWYKCTLVINSTGTQVDAYINGVFIGTSITTNLPTVPLSPASLAFKTVGATDISYHTDFMYYTKNWNTIR